MITDYDGVDSISGMAFGVYVSLCVFTIISMNRNRWREREKERGGESKRERERCLQLIINLIDNSRKSIGCAVQDATDSFMK